MAEIEYRKKNEEPSRPNCSGSSFSSVMIGTPARPTTILSAKFTSTKKNRRNVILQAPVGVGCVAMVVPLMIVFAGSFGSQPMLPKADRQLQPGIWLDRAGRGDRAFSGRAIAITIPSPPWLGP